MSEERKIKAQISSKDFILLEFDSVLNSLKELYERTEESELDIAIMAAKDYYRTDKEFMETVSFISKLIQLEASGKVIPPINFGTAYQNIVETHNTNKIARSPFKKSF